MVAMNEIHELTARIAREFRPERIVLFGSYADGSATEDSDVDLLVVMPFEGKSAPMAATILNRVSPTIPLELLVRTPQEVAQRVALDDFF